MTWKVMRIFQEVVKGKIKVRFKIIYFIDQTLCTYNKNTKQKNISGIYNGNKVQEYISGLYRRNI